MNHALATYTMVGALLESTSNYRERHQCKHEYLWDCSVGNERSLGLKQLFIRNDDNGQTAVGLLEKHAEFPMLSMLGLWLKR